MPRLAAERMACAVAQALVIHWRSALGARRGAGTGRTPGRAARCFRI